MNRDAVIVFAKECGWKVRDLNDNPYGKIIKAASFQVYNDFGTYGTLWTEESAWDRVVGIVTGSEDSVELKEDVHPLLTEMLAYIHPSLVGVRFQEDSWRKLNVFAWTERTEGDNKPTVYSATLGIAYAKSNPPTGIEFAAFRVQTPGNGWKFRDAAIHQIYTGYSTWAETQTDDPATWVNAPQPG